MYICSKCKKSTEPGEKINKVIVETREVEYNYKDGQKFKGWEIVKEINVCIRCLDLEEQSEVE